MAININIPSQVKEYADLASFPATGNAKTIYVAEDTNKLYRWDGSTYVEISAAVATTWGNIGGTLSNQTDLNTALGGKVNTEAGKGLSTNDYTNTEKSKLAGIEAGAEVNVNADWNASSGDAQILNKPDLSGYATTSDLTTGLATKQATLVSGTNIKTIEGNSLLGSGNIDLTKSDVGLGNVDNTSDVNKPVSTATQTALNAKQDTLVSGTSIKTVNSTSLLGSGDVAVQPTLVSGTNIKTINSTSVLGSGNISVQDPLTLTTTGTSGAATLVGSTLNIPQYSGGGTSNPKAIAVVVADGTGITSTTPSISRSVLIPANTLDTNCVLEVVWGSVRLVGASGTGQSALYVNTSNTLTGATLVAIGSNMTTTQNYVKCARDIQKIGTAAKTSTATQITSDYTLTGSVNSFTLNNSTDLYFLFTQSGGASDTMTIRNVRITQYS